ncbi:Hypothetical predicted protein [Mytilus galloprovincialis]|uniref:Transposase Helix-turn-helix domain-containing protein n=1 Tax=Mytilus galloprovincialis TaxID=29158 RepID=A0A8B6BMH3_MYTGA|nr:Hypothetical predicted protein [Mytilus galloprovincialis]
MREYEQELPISDTENTMDCSSTTSLTMVSNKTDFAVQKLHKQKKHIGLDLEVRIENSVLKNQNALLQSEIELLQCTLKEQEGCAKTSENETVVKYINMYLDVNAVKDDITKLKFYTGLTVPKFMCLWGYLGPSVNKLVYWNKDCGVPDRSHKKRPGPKQKMTPMNELFMTLIRIRQGLLLEDLSYRFGVSKTTVSRVVLTWIQFLYIRLSAFRTKMFPDRSKIRKHLPKSFKKYKNIRCIIDCTEVFVQQPRNLVNKETAIRPIKDIQLTID